MYIQLLVTNAEVILELCSWVRNTQNCPCKYMYIVPSGEDNVSKYHIYSLKYCLPCTHTPFELSLSWEGNFYSKIFYDYSPVEKAVLCYKVDRLVALLPTFSSVCCLQSDVCNLWCQISWRLKHIRMGACVGMGACPGQYDIHTNCIEQCMQVIQAWE